MKILYSCFTILLLAIFSQSFSVYKAEATVGGPTLIHSFKYNPENESIYFTQISEGGRGCPPSLMKKSLVTSEVEVVLSCEMGEKLMTSKDYDTAPVIGEIWKITENFKNLIPINLKENKIDINISFKNEEKFEFDPEWVKNSNFIGTIYQNDKKIGEINISGCNKEQPFVFEGYAIPGFEKKIALLLSTKGDCFEGGYIGESLYIVGVDSVNKDIYTNSYKSDSPLVPHEGTLVVYDKSQIKTETVDVKDTKGFSSIVLLSTAIISLIMGVCVGLVMKKNKV